MKYENHKKLLVPKFKNISNLKNKNAKKFAIKEIFRKLKI